jgi:hypothetical protein
MRVVEYVLVLKRISLRHLPEDHQPERKERDVCSCPKCWDNELRSIFIQQYVFVQTFVVRT